MQRQCRCGGATRDDIATKWKTELIDWAVARMQAEEIHFRASLSILSNFMLSKRTGLEEKNSHVRDRCLAHRILSGII